MSRVMMSLAIVAAATVIPARVGARQAITPSALTAREDRAIGSHPGTLRLDANGLAFETGDARDDRRWSYEQVRQFRFESSRRLVVEVYESRGWTGFGKSRTFEYRTDGAIPAEWVAFASAHSAKPVVTSILPPRPVPAAQEVPVNHEGTDTAGVLRLYGDGLAFETDRDGYARFWRFEDLDSVLRQDRYRLLVSAYEGSREHVRPFLFTLKEELAPALFDVLWRRLNERRTSTGEGAR